MKESESPERLMMLFLLLVNRIPVLQDCVTAAENPTTRNMNPNAKPRMPNVEIVA